MTSVDVISTYNNKINIEVAKMNSDAIIINGEIYQSIKDDPSLQTVDIILDDLLFKKCSKFKLKYFLIIFIVTNLTNEN